MTKKQSGARLTDELDVTPLPDCLEGQQVGMEKRRWPFSEVSAKSCLSLRLIYNTRAHSVKPCGDH